jgi:hypothetical protein
MENIIYTERDIREMTENPAFRAFMQDVEDRIAITQEELATCPRESVVMVSEGKLTKTPGCEFHQGELASLRFFQNVAIILKEDLEGGASNAD